MPIPSCQVNRRSQKSLFSLLVNLYIILITISFPFRFSTCVQSELIIVNSTNPVAQKSHVNMTATALQLTVMPGSASLWTLKHTRKSEASTFQKISEQMWFPNLIIHGYPAARRNWQMRASISLRLLKKINSDVLTDKICKSLQKLLFSAKIYVDSWWSCNVWYHCYKAIKLFESEIHFCHEPLCQAAILKSFFRIHFQTLYVIKEIVLLHMSFWVSFPLPHTLPRKPLCRFVSFEPTPVHVYPVKRVYIHV